MRVVDRPVGIQTGGKGFLVFDLDTEIAEASATQRVRQTLAFVLADDASQRMLLAVAEMADECGIAAGWDAATGTTKGVSVAELALKAGMPLRQARSVLNRLCRDEYLFRLQTKTRARGLVWVLLRDYTNDSREGVL